MMRQKSMNPNFLPRDKFLSRWRTFSFIGHIDDRAEIFEIEGARKDIAYVDKPYPRNNV